MSSTKNTLKIGIFCLKNWHILFMRHTVDKILIFLITVILNILKNVSFEEIYHVLYTCHPNFSFLESAVVKLRSLTP